MEKYGVKQTKTTKTASEDGTCTCGCRVKEHGAIKWCPRCGTEPWEDDGNSENPQDTEDLKD